MANIKVNDIKSTSADLKPLTNLELEELKDIVGGCHGDDVHLDERFCFRPARRVRKVSSVL